MRCRPALLCAVALCLTLDGAAAAEDPVRVAQAHNATVGLIAGDAGSTDTEIAAEMAHVLDNGTKLRLLPMVGEGSVQNLADLIFLKNVDVAIVDVDALTQTLENNAILRKGSVEYITKLFQEEVHVLAQDSVGSVADLAGKPVEVGPLDSDSALTADTLLGTLHIRPDELHDSMGVSLERLRLGEVAAVVVVGGKPVPALLTIPPNSGLHFLPVPLNTQLVDSYLPGSLDSQQYPNLVAPGQPVDTVAVGSLLVTLTASAGTERGERVNRFVDTLFARFHAFRQPGLHPKWREVNLAAQIPGLRRYGEAERLLSGRANAASGRQQHSGP